MGRNKRVVYELWCMSMYRQDILVVESYYREEIEERKAMLERSESLDPYECFEIRETTY